MVENEQKVGINILREVRLAKLEASAVPSVSQGVGGQELAHPAGDPINQGSPFGEQVAIHGRAEDARPL